MPAFDLDRPVPFRGPQPATILMLGEGPGEKEHYSGRPFVGPSGEELKMYLAKSGLSIHYIRLGNVVEYWTGPGNPDPEPEDLERDRDGVLYEILMTKPTYIIAVGRFALNFFFPDMTMDEAHGKAFHFDLGPWYSMPGPWNVTIISVFHPAYGLHQPHKAGAIFKDFQAAGAIIKGGAQWDTFEDQYPRPDYALHLRRDTLEMPTHAVEMEFEPGEHWWLRQPKFGIDSIKFRGAPIRWDFHPVKGLSMDVDTEGWVNAPFCLTYSLAPGWGRLIRADDERGIRLFHSFLDEYRPRLSFHWAQHDIIILLAIFELHGLDTATFLELIEDCDDTMFMAYEIGESQGLKTSCARHHGMQMLEYEDLTRPYDDAQARAYLEAALAHPEVLALPKPDAVLEFKNGEQKIRKPNHVKNRIESVLRPPKEDAKSKKAHPRDGWFKIEPEIRGPVEEIVGPMPRFTLDLVPFEDVLPYACRDADGTGRVRLHYKALIAADEYLTSLYEMDRDLISIASEMERVGMPCDADGFIELGNYFEFQAQKLLMDIKGLNGGEYLNPNSPKQVRYVLFTKLGLKPKKLTKKGELSTNAKTLESLQREHPMPKKLVAYREVAKLDSSFVKTLPLTRGADGRIHARAKITKAITGRRAFDKPPMQAIPTRTEEGKRIRDEFTEDFGFFIASADYSQIEMRVMAHLSEDALLIKRFESGFDVHSATAADMFGYSYDEIEHDKKLRKKLRDPAKRAGFGVITGISEYGLLDQFELAGVFDYDLADCRRFIEGWFDIYRGVWGYIQGIRESARRRGYVRTMWGRPRDLPGIWSSIPYVRAEAERATHSHAIQGTAAEVQKLAEGRLKSLLRKPRWREIQPILTVHDELLIRGPRGKGLEEAAKELLTDAMLHVQPRFKVPIVIEYGHGQSWGELK